MHVSVYDQYPSDGRPSRIRYWLRMNSWSVSQAALLFCDVPPDLTELDNQQELIGCIDLGGKAYGQVSSSLWARRQGNSEEGEEEDDEPKFAEAINANGNSNVEPIDETDSIAPIANRFRDLRQRLEAEVNAGLVPTHMSPSEWISYAVANQCTVPWLGWARRKREFRSLFPKDVDATGAGVALEKLRAPGRRSTKDRDKELQRAANDLAKELKAKGKPSPTRKQIAYQLSLRPEGLEVNCDRIERIIRRQW